MSQLAQQFQSSLLFSFMDKYLGYILRFISTIIIARLLSPEEIGIFSVAFVIIGLGHVLRDFGVAQYLIQEKDLRDHKIKAAFATMFMIAWSMWFILYLGKDLLAAFYDEPRLTSALNILIIIFLLAPFGSIRIALMRRQMMFKTLAKINIFSYITLFIVTLVLCYFKFSFMALVWGQLAGVLATNLGCVLVCRKNYWYFPSLQGARAVIKFGFNITLANIIENLAEGAPDLFIGKFMNMQAVGIYSRAQGCVGLFKIFVTASVWPVILPYFSIKNRAGIQLLPDYLTAISIYTIFAWPFFIALMVLAEPIVLLLYGQQWHASILLVQILCLSAIFEASFPFRAPLLVALGNTQLNLKLQFMTSGMKIMAILIGSCYGLIYAALSLVLSEFIAQLYIFHGLKSVVKLNFMNWFEQVRLSLLVSILLGVVCFSLKLLSANYAISHWQLIMSAIALCALLWLAVVLYFKHPLSQHLVQFYSRFKRRSLREETL
ncbi:lipopolysaccharide biosynthesis protein [Candidatus Berkiella cookevillensis]|uniref:Lipopolysaccharide biosynthesis protein n=1 Tax=Candidatus Berkiella cookevillensis TaxID=437022 RepID=A0A0Q9YKS2_9GAMM|nr:lipopolysaccharide biosynthesis protein [Candidatus Berkiella cookevillensis]MCS5709126.1 lipopolysaccharide biosynthesis protein [Candidatus Berkiella cookevillensis]